MKLSWKKGYDPNLICSKLEDIKQLQNGNVTFQGFQFQELSVLIQSILNLPPEIPEIDAKRCIIKAIFSAGKKGVIKHDSILRELNKEFRDYFNLPINRFVLVTTISVDLPSEKKSWILKINGKTIILEKRLPKTFRDSAKDLIYHASKRLFAKPPNNYTPIRVFVSARTPDDAANKAINDLDFIRGLWNLILNMKTIRRHTQGIAKPVNKIVLGPIHTLHKPNGQMAVENVWWYEPNYLGTVKLSRLDKSDWLLINKNFPALRRKLKSHTYSNEIIEAILRYTRALDESIYTTAFIKLWGVLELLTDTIDKSHEEAIKRVAFLYAERDFHLQVLQNLRRYRNVLVHTYSESYDAEIFLFQLKEYIENLLLFHIANGRRFSSLKEASSFLSLPHSDETLKKRIKLLKLAMKFRGYS